MGKRFAAAVILAAAMPGTPLAQSEGETVLRQLLLDVELHPDWSASLGSLRSEEGRTIAEGLTIEATDGGPTISVSR